MRNFWWLCNNSEIRLWLWKVWSLVFCSQNLFKLQEHVKTTKTRFLFAKKRWTWYPTNNYHLATHFNQLMIERKICVWTTNYQRPSELCIVQHVKMKIVFTFQPIKRLISTTVKSAKPAATIILLSGDGTHCFARKRVATKEKKSHLHFGRNFSANHNQAHRNLNQKMLKWVQIWNKRNVFLLADDLSHILNF